MSRNQDEGRRFLENFLERLAEHEEASRTLAQVNTDLFTQNAMVIRQQAQLIQQNGAMLRNLERIAASMDGLAQRADILANLLYDPDDPARGYPETLGHPSPFGMLADTFGKEMGRAVGRAANGFLYGEGGGSRRGP